jgi:hypothetical protein
VTRADGCIRYAGKITGKAQKGVKKSGGVSGKSFITKPLTVILNLTQPLDSFKQVYSLAVITTNSLISCDLVDRMRGCVV